MLSTDILSTFVNATARASPNATGVSAVPLKTQRRPVRICHELKGPQHSLHYKAWALHPRRLAATATRFSRLERQRVALDIDMSPDMLIVSGHLSKARITPQKSVALE